MLKFFQTLYGTATKGFISFWGQDNQHHNEVCGHTPVTNLNQAAIDSQDLSDAGYNAYYGVGLRSQDLGKYRRGKEAEVIGIPGFWLDIDLAGPAHKADNYPPTKDAALSLLEDVPKPTLLVDSGYGLHCYWLFTEFLYFANDAERFKARRIIDNFQNHICKKAESQKYKIDHVSDLARVLRIPGTINYKDPNNLKTVRVIDESGPRSSFAVWESRYKSSTISVLASAETTGQQSKDQVLINIKNKLKFLKKKETKELADAVLKGESFATLGSRDSKLQQLCAAIAMLDPDSDASILVEIIRPSLEKMKNEGPKCPSLENALDKLQRAQIKAREIRDEGERIKSRLKNLANDNSEAKNLRLIIQSGNAYYVYKNGTYRRPFTQNELRVGLKKALQGLPIDWLTYDSKGNPKEKTIEQVLSEYGTVATEVVADLTTNVSYFDENTEVFYEAVCPLRKIEPKFHENIDRWLHIFAGKDIDKLLDWLATVRNLKRQTCALYLSGPAGAGKTLLANAVARLWTEGPPTELKKIIDNFNADLMRCPVIFADEQIPASYPGQNVTAELRAIIGTQSRTLSRKFLNNSVLRGAIRMILAANNERLLVQGQEDLGHDDLEAYAARFLYIETTEASKDYLESIGGMSKETGTKYWVDGDMIAEHIIYLEKTRTVQAGKRFLVEGDLKRMRHLLAPQSRWSNLALQWLAFYLDDPRPSVNEQSSPPIVGDGEILINATTIINSWEEYLKGYQKPNAQSLGRALKTVSRKTKNIGGLNYRIIDTEAFLSWAEENHIGNIDVMRKRILGSIPAVRSNIRKLKVND